MSEGCQFLSLHSFPSFHPLLSFAFSLLDSIHPRRWDDIQWVPLFFSDHYNSSHYYLVLNGNVIHIWPFHLPALFSLFPLSLSLTPLVSNSLLFLNCNSAMSKLEGQDKERLSYETILIAFVNFSINCCWLFLVLFLCFVSLFVIRSD